MQNKIVSVSKEDDNILSTINATYDGNMVNGAKPIPPIIHLKETEM